MTLEEEIMETALQYVIGLEDTNYRIQAVIHVKDLPALIKECLELFKNKLEN